MKHSSEEDVLEGPVPCPVVCVTRGKQAPGATGQERGVRRGYFMFMPMPFYMTVSCILKSVPSTGISMVEIQTLIGRIAVQSNPTNSLVIFYVCVCSSHYY